MLRPALLLALMFPLTTAAQEHHDHPAPEKLGQLFLAQHNNAAAAIAFKTKLINVPGRRGAIEGAAQTATAH